jgi:soluble lytic murein transglycosylase
MLDEARIEFEELRNLLQSDPANSYRLTNYLLDLGLYRSAILSARQILDLAGMSDADTMSAPAFFNHVRFGTYFSELIFPVAEEYGFDPLFLFSVVRQESAFEGFVRSSAGARGLMQIIPTTGQEVSSALSWPEDYTDEDLYRPFVSVRLGSEYLAKWRDHFNNDLYAALAAYNGGPGNAIAWQGLSNSDPDLFLEVVGFDETRNYLRGISEIYGIYRRIYSRTP